MKNTQDARPDSGRKEGCEICNKYKHFVFTGYKTLEDALAVDGRSRAHVSGGVAFCPRCGKRL